MKYIYESLLKLSVLILGICIVLFSLKMNIWYTFSSFLEIIAFLISPLLIIKVIYDLIKFIFAKNVSSQIKISEIINKENWNNYSVLDEFKNEYLLEALLQKEIKTIKINETYNVKYKIINKKKLLIKIN